MKNPLNCPECKKNNFFPAMMQNIWWRRGSFLKPPSWPCIKCGILLRLTSKSHLGVRFLPAAAFLFAVMASFRRHDPFWVSFLLAGAAYLAAGIPSTALWGRLECISRKEKGEV